VLCGTQLTGMFLSSPYNLHETLKFVTIFRYQHSNQTKKVPKIYNYVSSTESPLTWGRFIKKMHGHYFEVPPLRSMWYIFYIFYTNLLIGTVLRILLHKIPAALMDLLLIICGKPPK
jgi:alcohol-forming fatty acyl-CoA reductase